MPIFSIADLRKQVGPDWKDVSDEDLISSYAKSIDAPAATVAYQLGFGLEEGGKTSKRASSAVDRYQAGLYGLGEEVTKAVGAEDTSAWLGERRRANELRAETDALRAQQLGAVDAWKDVHGVRDFADYAVGLGIQSAPYLAESLAGGLIARGAMTGTRAALTAAKTAGDVEGAVQARRALDIGSTVGGTVASYPSSVSDILSSQREQADKTDLGSAALLGVPYAAANALGIGGAASRAALFRNTVDLLDSAKGLKGGALRMGATGVTTGIKEGGSETFQEMMNQAGRMAVDERATMTSEDALERYKESFIGGAVLGGMTASALGGWRRSQPTNDIQQTFQETSTGNVPTDQTAPPPAAPVTPPAASVAPAVVGGTTDIAQAQAQAAAEQQNIQAAQQQQASREEFTQRFGGVQTIDAGNGQVGYRFLNENYYTPQDLNAAIDKNLAKDQGKPEYIKQAEAAFVATHATTEKTPTPASVTSQLAKFTNGTTSVDQIAARVNTEISSLAKSGKTVQDTRLSKLAEFYENLTGQVAPGYELAQQNQPKGAKNGKLQATTGLGTVPVQGGAGEAGGGIAGPVQPGGVQPEQPGSVPQGSLGLQVGQPAGVGVRNGPGAVSGAGISEPVGAGQGQGALNEQGPAVGQTQVQPAGAEAVGPGVQETAGPAVEVPTAEEVTEATLDSVIQEVMSLLIKPTSRMDEATAAKQRDFVFTLLMNGPYDSLAVMAADFGITPSQAKDWSAKAKALQEDPSQLAAAFQAVADDRGLSVADLVATIEGKQELTPGEAVLEDETQGTSRTEEPMESDEVDAFAREEGEEVSDRELTDEGLSVKGRKSGESLQERYNAVETNQAKILRLSNQLAVAEDAGDQDAIDRLNAELDAAIAKGVEQSNKRTKTAGTAVAATERAPESAEMTAAAARWKEVGGDLTKLTDAEVKAILARAQSFNNKKLVADASAELTSRGVEHAVQKPSAAEVPVRQRAGGGQAVGGGNAEERQAAAKGEVEAVRTPQEQYEALTEGYPVPAWDELSENNRAQIEDLAHRDQLNLSALNTVMAGENAASKNVERKSDKEKIFELQRTRAEPKQGQVIRFNLSWVPGGHEVEAVVGKSVYMDNHGREVPQGTPGAKRYVYLTYKVDGQQITNYFSSEELRLNTLGSVESPKLYALERLASDAGGETVRKLPSFIRGMASLLRLRNSGKITDEQFAQRSDALYEEVQNAKLEKPINPRQRGALFIRQRLLEAVRKGWITERSADMAEWFIKQNPALVDTLGVSFSGKGDGKSGEYAHFTRIMTLIKGSANEETAVHEILHHLERMMPVAIQNAIRSAWLRSLLKAEKSADGNLRQFYDLLMQFHFGAGRQDVMKAAVQMIQDGKVGYEHYQHVNSSEFWAVNASRIMEGRFDVRNSVVGKIKQWLKEFIETVKGVLGLKSDAAVLRALSSVMKGDGEFVTGQQMLQEGVGYNMFAGQKASAGNETFLVTARFMEANGESPRDIWNATGWYKGPDGLWRFEIDDSGAQFKEPLRSTDFKKLVHMQEMPLEDVLDHPELFERYPELRDVKFEVRSVPLDAFREIQGWFDDKKNKLFVTPYANNPLSTVLHELQHWVQAKEGFENGANPRTLDLSNKAALNKLRTALIGVQNTLATKEAEALEARKTTGKYISTFDEAVAARRAKDMLEGVDGLLAHADELSPLYARLAALDAEIERLEKARAVLDKKFKEQNKQVNIAKKLIDYAGQMKDLRFYTDKIRAVSDEFDQVNSETKALVSKYTGGRDVAYNIYRLVSGEAEARNTQFRQQWDFFDRAANFPEDTLDVPVASLLTSTGRGGAYANIERLPTALQAPTRAVTTNMWAGVKKAGLALAITEDVVKLAMQTMKSAGDYLKAQYAQQAERLQFELKVEKILQQFDKLPKNLQGTGEGSVNALIHDMTMDGKWGFVPSYNPGVRVDPQMKLRFEMLKAQSPAAAKLIQDVFDHGYQALKTKQQAVKDAADKVFTEREAAAQGDAKELADIALERKAYQAKFDRLLKIKTDKPYAYLGRYGNYVAVAKSTDFVEAQRLSRNGDLDATKWLKENESNPDHYVVAFAETQAEADAIAARLRGLGNFQVTDAFEKLAGDAYAGGGDLFLAFKRLENMITRKAKNGDQTGDVLDGMRKLMTDMYLTTLAEASAQMPTLARKSIYGADKDMMRNLATRGRADAHFLAALKHGNDVTDAMDAMMDEAEQNRRESTPVLNELLKRQSQSMQYKLPGQVAQVATQLSTIYYLSTSPAFYIQQMLQTAVLSLPFMAGRLGYFRSARAITQAYKDMSALVKGLGVNDHVEFADAPADVKTMLETLVGMGKIDIGIDNDAKARSSEQGVVAKVMRKLQGVNSRLETINRATAAIAAYRGYLQKYGADKTAAATQYAADVVSNTHGSYDGFNTPRALSSDVGRVVGQFKRFQIIQLSMLGKLIHTSFKGAGQEERAVARSALRYITAHMAVLGGALGVPFVSQIGNILLGIFGDDDEPKDLEQYLRGVLDDKALADLLLRGVPSAVGLESLGKKLAMENVASLLPFTELDLTNRDALTKVYVAMLGPSAALSLKFADGLGMMRQGNFYKGMEMLLPNGVSNVLKAGRFATEGVTMRSGDTVMGPEEVTILDAAFQAIGLPTDVITDRQRIQKVVAETDQFYEDRAAQVKRDYTKAFKNGDSSGMQDAREAWQELQDARTRNGYSRQAMSVLFRAPMQQAKRERGTTGGVEFSKTNRSFVERIAAQ